MENPVQPSVFVSPKGKSSFDLKGLLSSKKLWILFAVVLVLGGGGWLMVNRQQLSSLQTDSQTPSEIQPLSGGELSLTSEKTDYKVGDTVPVTVKVYTGGFPTLGTDVVVKYDPNILELGSATSLVSGDAYPEYPSKNFDQKTGMVTISGISALNGKEFSGLADFATINFKAKATGTANISFDFAPGGTADSNIIKLGVENAPSVDILSKVSDLRVNIK